MGMPSTDPGSTAPAPSTSAGLAADVAAAVSTFGAAVTPRLASRVGEPEDQMRGPLEVLLDATAASLGVRFSAEAEVRAVGIDGLVRRRCGTANAGGGRCLR